MFRFKRGMKADYNRQGYIRDLLRAAANEIAEAEAEKTHRMAFVKKLEGRKK